MPLNAAALEILDRLDTKESYAYLFVNKRTSKPYTWIHKAWEKLRKEAGMPHLRIHDLRHQFATLLIKGGRSLYEVQKVLGHSDPQVTQRYSHLTAGTLADAAESVDSALGIGPN